MDTVTDLIKGIANLPTERLLVLVALAAIGLAAFSIHAVWSIAKERKEERS
jgi:hypothetical protein